MNWCKFLKFKEIKNQDEIVGFIINKPLEFNLDDLFKDLGKDLEVFNGGPVNKENLYYIHNVPELISNSLEISKNLFWGGDFSDVKNCIKEKKLRMNNIRFFSGYSGWTLDQLNNEIKEKAWVITNNRFGDKILESKSNEFWKNEIKMLGDEYIIWSNAPENPKLN